MALETFNVSAARSRFPALQKSQVYLDNAGGSQVLGSVIESISDYLSNTNVQLGASYETGKISSKLFDEGNAAGAKYVNAGEDEIVFGPCTTQLLLNVSYTFNFHEGDEIIVSSIDHESNIGPWLSLAKRQNLVVKWWTPNNHSNPELQPEDLRSLLSPRTRLVTCTHCSNILGTITNIKAIAETVHTIPGALLAVDGVAYAPHRPIDVKELGVDIYCFSWYKVYGPHIAMLYANRHAQNQMQSLNHFFNSTETLQDKLEISAASYELVQSIPEIVDYLGPQDSGVWQAIMKQEESLQSILLEYLNSQPEIFTVYGHKDSNPNHRVSTISFTVKGQNAQEFVETVEKGTSFGFRWGKFYSDRLVDRLTGEYPEGVVRVSAVHYNTEEEMKGLVAAMRKVLTEQS